MPGVPLPPKPPYKPFTVSTEYRLVGGPRHGQVEFVEDATVLYEPLEPEAVKAALRADGEMPPLREGARVTYRLTSFGSDQGDLPPLRLDVMLAEELCALLNEENGGDRRHPDVAWALLDAFMHDIPNAKAMDEKSSMARCKRAIIEARAALKRARFALPKEPHDPLGNSVAYVVENAVTRCDIALDYIDGVDRSVLRADAQEASGG